MRFAGGIMGFYSDFIEQCLNEQRKITEIYAAAEHSFEVRYELQKIADKIAEGDVGRLLSSGRYFGTLARRMQQAKIIRMSAEQCQVFLDTPTLGSQDARWMRLPFERVWLQLDQPMKFVSTSENYKRLMRPESLVIDSESDHDDMPVNVHGVLLQDMPVTEFTSVISADGTRALTMEGEDKTVDTVFDKQKLLFRDGRLFYMKDIERMISVHFVSPIKKTIFNEDSAVLVVMKDGTLEWSKGDAYADRRAKMLQFIIHTINFLASPSVKLVRQEPDAKLQKARVAKNKPVLPGWYEITYRHHVNDYGREKVSPGLYHHSFRYDVRGHFKRFEKGPMAGRVIWCPPHQRGLANTLYKPKVYRATNSPGSTSELWRGE